MKKLVIAIDGPAGAGKSTVSRVLARRLGYRYLDTGAMYRALTLKALESGLDLRSEKEIAGMTAGTELALTSRGRVLLDGRDVTRRIRGEDVSRGVSLLSRFGKVRTIVRRKQRALAGDGGVVMEGRDIGTAVLPDADLKFYLDASLAERARRRCRELKAQGAETSLAAVTRSIAERDRRDRRRKESPLRRAEDARVVDSTGLSAAAVAALLREAVAEKKKQEKEKHQWNIRKKSVKR